MATEKTSRNKHSPTSTENCKSLLVLTTDLNSTYRKINMRMTKCISGGKKKTEERNPDLGAETTGTLQLHRLAISCSTPIDREGKKFDFPASLWKSLLLDAWSRDILSSAKSLVNKHNTENNNYYREQMKSTVSNNRTSLTGNRSIGSLIKPSKPICRKLDFRPANRSRTTHTQRIGQCLTSQTGWILLVELSC